MVCGDSCSKDFKGFRCHKHFTSPTPPIKMGIHSGLITAVEDAKITACMPDHKMLLFLSRKKVGTLKCIRGCFPLQYMDRTS